MHELVARDKLGEDGAVEVVVAPDEGTDLTLAQATLTEEEKRGRLGGDGVGKGRVLGGGGGGAAGRGKETGLLQYLWRERSINSCVLRI